MQEKSNRIVKTQGQISEKWCVEKHCSYDKAYHFDNFKKTHSCSDMFFKNEYVQVNTTASTYRLAEY